MDVLNDDVTSVGHIIAGISDVVKTETNIGDVSDPVSVKVLWNTGDSQLSSFEVIPDGVPEVKPVVDGSLGEMGHSGGDQMLTNGHGLTDAASLTQQGSEENTILGNDDISEGHMLHVPESDGTILADTPTTIQVATSLASELAANSDHDVIQLLLPTEESNDTGGAGLQSMNISLGAGSIAGPLGNQPTQTVQAITLADGTTAFIQHPNGKFLEGQTITLEDGSTAVVQGLPSKLSTVNLVTTSTVPNISSCKTESIETQAIQGVQLEDGTATFLNQAVKDGLQAIILEDGTTAYLATQQSQGFMENAQLEATTLTLDQLTSPVGGVQALLPNGIVNMDGKPISITSQTVVSQGTDQAGGIDSKATLVMSTSGVDKSSPFVEKAYKCSYDSCGRFYTTLHHLRVHERSHTGDRPFRCEFNGCGKAFATGYGLKSHFRVHTGEKPYKCPEGSCDKAFKTSGDLQKHVRTHTGERPFRCPFEGCTRSFTTSNIRKVHIRTHTGERPYTCPEEGCGRAFASATNYKNHIRIHTGEKPYVCTVQGCGKRFTEYSSLYKHHVVHTHAKPYTCNRCGKTYRQTSTLAMHKRTSHGEDVTAESEALLYDQTQNVTVEGLEPPDKRQRFNFSLNQEEIQDEGEGTLIINTSEPGQQHLALVGNDSLTSVSTDGLQSTSLTNHTALLQQAGVATFTLGDQGQQVYVITDPAQLEALQQIAQHQFDSENLTSSLITSLPSGDVTALDSTDVTTVTEINPSTDITDNQVSSLNPSHETDIQNY